MPEKYSHTKSLISQWKNKLYIECLIFVRPYSRTIYLAHRKRKGAFLKHLILANTNLIHYSNIREVNKNTASIQQRPGTILSQLYSQRRGKNALSICQAFYQIHTEGQGQGTSMPTIHQVLLYYNLLYYNLTHSGRKQSHTAY